MLDEGAKDTKNPNTSTMSVTGTGPAGWPGGAWSDLYPDSGQERLALRFVTPIPEEQIAATCRFCLDSLIDTVAQYTGSSGVSYDMGLITEVYAWAIHREFFVADGSTVEVTGNGDYGGGESPNGTYTEDGTANGKTKYTADGGTWELHYDGVDTWHVHKIADNPATDPCWKITQAGFVGSYSAINGATGTTDVDGNECATWNSLDCDLGNGAPATYAYDGDGSNSFDPDDVDVDELADPWDIENTTNGQALPITCNASADYIYGVMLELTRWQGSSNSSSLDYSSVTTDIAATYAGCCYYTGENGV